MLLNYVKSELQLPTGFESMKQVAGKRGVYEEADFTKHGNLWVKRGVSVGNIDEYYYFHIKGREEPIVVHVEDGGKRDRIFKYTRVTDGGFDISEEAKKLRPLVEWVRKNDSRLVDHATDPAKFEKLQLLK